MEENIKKYVSFARMPGRFNKSRVKESISFMGKTFYEAGPEDINPKLSYKTTSLVNPDTKEKIILYY